MSRETIRLLEIQYPVFGISVISSSLLHSLSVYNIKSFGVAELDSEKVTESIDNEPPNLQTLYLS